ncbi:MAG: hypothetical protein UR89_C0021G0010 [Candidatus Roizmanbacteria bacterium GW2011_GWA2_35_8]|uniref:Uncharacterized protein n=1 Tax=Candidatus Roizmanbacteria bacterium GW2011_GWA2_35_8 TaxID=1618479 RepID=A0A0G0CZQ2_9BACT|nr:MAG: hypothetical protein UR89_C0021G0010 [Candidatus Roizmanbacteria bacterium GW2011_GWA2_35_8]
MAESKIKPTFWELFKFGAKLGAIAALGMMGLGALGPAAFFETVFKVGATGAIKGGLIAGMFGLVLDAKNWLFPGKTKK